MEWTDEDLAAYEEYENEYSLMYENTLSGYEYCASQEDYGNMEMKFQLTGIFPNVTKCMNAAKNKKRMASVLLDMSAITLGCGVKNERRYAQVLDELKKWKAQ